jgi:hypothetical protein
LVVPQGPLDPGFMAATIQGLEVVNLVRTPLGASLAAVADDLGDAPGPKIVVLITDGEETCDGDSAAAIQALVDSGIDVRVNIVGFALDDEALKAQFEAWAQLGNGQYIDAGNAADLAEAVTRAVQPLYEVIDSQGNVIATGQVGGLEIELPAGTYRIDVLTEPIQTYEGVVVRPGERVSLELDEEAAMAGGGIAQTARLTRSHTVGGASGGGGCRSPSRQRGSSGCSLMRRRSGFGGDDAPTRWPDSHAGADGAVQGTARAEPCEPERGVRTTFPGEDDRPQCRR